MSAGMLGNRLVGSFRGLDGRQDREKNSEKAIGHCPDGLFSFVVVGCNCFTL